MQKFLGVAIGERSMLVAEVTGASPSMEATRTVEFVYPEGLSPQAPLDLGKALGEFLSASGFSARGAVFGLPAKWTLTRSYELPPMDPAHAPQVLRLRAESEFSTEFKDLVHDFAGIVSAEAASRLLLVSAPRKYIEQVIELAKAARLEPRAILPTSMALAAATQGRETEGTVVSIMPWGAELVVQRGASPVLLRHISGHSALGGALAGEVRRAAAGFALNGHGTAGASSNGHGSHVVVWDDSAGAGGTTTTTALDMLGPQARGGDFAALGVAQPAETDRRSAAAVALAVVGIGGKLPVDLLHPRLAEPKKSALPRPAVLAMIAGGLVLLLCIFALFHLHARRSELADLQSRAFAQAKRLDEAKAEVAMIQFARGWHADSPHFLNCLAELNAAIPEDGSMYLTSFNLHENFNGGIAGKTRAPENLAWLEKRLNASRHFSGVKISSSTQPGARRGQETSFSVAFQFVP